MEDRDILADIRAWRDEFARQHDYDVAAMFATLRRLEAEYVAAGGRLALPGKPRPPAFVPVEPPPGQDG